MSTKDLKKLSRRELVDIIYQLKKNEQQLQAENVNLQNALREKRMRLSEAGSLADAAASVSNLLTAAQNTADLYLSEISSMREDARKESSKIIEDAIKTVAQVFTEGEKRCAELNACYQAELQRLQLLQAEIQTLENMM